MAFRIPSTPNARSLQSQPSTTPAGPPPTWLTDKSTTPAGPPPRMNFNSSFNPSNNTFGSRGYAAPDFDDDDYEYEDDDMEADAHADGEGDGEFMSTPVRKPYHNSLAASRGSPRGLKRSRDGRIRDGSEMATIARGMISRSKPAPLQEDDDILMRSESFASSLDHTLQTQVSPSESALTEQCAQLTNSWSRYSDATTKQGEIGPASKNGFDKANYLASLLLQLHYPHTHITSKMSAARQMRGPGGARPQLSVPVPEALLKWLDTYHLPFPDDYDAVHLHRPSPSAHESFWDLLFASTLRGKLDRVVRLLKDAGWEHACTALDDGSMTAGYTGIQLQYTQEVVQHAAQVLESSPALQYGDWDVKNADWTAFRQRIKVAVDELNHLAGSGMGQSQPGNMFRQSMEDSLSMSTASRRAESRIPWAIYENLSLLYKLLLGHVEDILLTSQDWLEASIYLTVWWDGSDSNASDGGLEKSVARKNAVQKPREVDIAPLPAYRARLADAFAQVTDNPDDNVFAVNTMDLVEVGLACIMEDSVGSGVGILRTLSMPIAVSVVEIASTGGWLPLARPRSRGHLLGQGFSKEDLLVLSHGPPQVDPQEIDRDSLLGEYADLLSKKAQINDKEGWELAIAVLSRQDDAVKSTKQISHLLDDVALEDEASVNKVLNVCDRLEIKEQRMAIAERYADSLAERNSQEYGAALLYYARAQAVSKLRKTLELLTSLCLLHSAAMPTRETIDSKLEGFISKDRPALRDLAAVDLEAATLLSTQLSGYATLRRFYDLRDQHISSSSTSGPAPAPARSLERKRHAATALFGVIQSAADCISGGLYDRAAESVISVEGLLALFGEALPLLGTSQRIFTETQIFALLAIVEDYSAAPARIHDDANSLLSASIAAYMQEVHGPAAAAFGGKDASAASSTWDLLASQSLVVVPPAGEAEASKVAIEKRAWDWRRGLVAVHGPSSVAGVHVVALLREALVREIANGWGGLVDWSN